MRIKLVSIAKKRRNIYGDYKTVLMFINKGKKVYDGVLHVVKRLGIKKVISK